MAAAVVLVEGRSDAAALDVLVRRRGLADRDISIVAMGGVTNVGRYLGRFADRPNVRVGGLCDAGEVRFVLAALRRQGYDVRSSDDLGGFGFFVCWNDLEDELIRALGVDRVVEVVAREGELGQLRTFQRQPAQRDRSLSDQLHRFAGTTSGRKVRLAAALAADVEVGAVPAPLRDVLTFASAAVAAVRPDAPDAEASR